jgi:hypothetical protein
MSEYALIQDGIVTNTIIADESFVASIADKFDDVIEIVELHPRPSIGWGFTGESFIDPYEQLIDEEQQEPTPPELEEA